MTLGTPARTAVLGALAILAVAGTGCVSFVEPSPELRAALRQAPPQPGPCVRAKVKVTVDSPWISGIFDGVIVARTGDAPQVRMQLFPDLGPKALDLVASATNVTGYLPHKGQGAARTLPLDGNPTPLDGLGITLVEHFSTLGESRALGMIEREDGWTVQIEPMVADLGLKGRISRDGRIHSRAFRKSWLVKWEQVVEPDGGFSIHARGISLKLDILQTTPLQRLPDKLFVLRLPEGTAPLDR